MSGDLASDPRLAENLERRMRALEANQREFSVAMQKGFEHVEARFERLNGDILKLIEGSAELRGRVSQLPTTVTLLAFVLAVLGMAGALRIFVH